MAQWLTDAQVEAERERMVLVRCAELMDKLRSFENQMERNIHCIRIHSALIERSKDMDRAIAENAAARKSDHQGGC